MSGYEDKRKGYSIFDCGRLMRAPMLNKACDAIIGLSLYFGRLKPEVVPVGLRAVVKDYLTTDVSAKMPACKGRNCGATDGVSHSPECFSEHDAAIGFVETTGATDVPDSVIRELRQGAFVLAGLSPCGGFLQLDQVEADRLSEAMDGEATVLENIKAAGENK